MFVSSIPTHPQSNHYPPRVQLSKATKHVVPESSPSPAGLWHSWQNGWEYEDYSTAMGRGNACPNAPELARMSWATAAPNGNAVNSMSLAIGVARSFILPATYLTGDGVYVRIQADWLINYPIIGKNLYLAVRVAKGSDTTINANYASRVNIHEVNATMVSSQLDS